MGTQPRIEQPQVQETDVVIVGAGFGGLCMAIKLLEAGNRNFVLLEKAGDVGGTWHYNSYPGAACDVQSHMYSYSFEGNPDWSKRYSPWNEIRQYIVDTTEKYGLRPYIRFNQVVNGAHFDAQSGRWTVQTQAGDTFRCKYWVMASGPLHVPSIPDIKGLEKFRGKVFHSAQWDHDYDLKGKNVVSIGTGGSAIQYCPEIAPDVKQLYVFQRTPAWVLPRDERGYFGFEKKLFARIPALRRLHRARLYWSNEARVLPMLNPSIARGVQQLAKLFIRLQVKDKALVEKLTPDYTIGCKRILISNKWFPMFNRDNVELVTDGIAEIRENSIVTRDGVERPADCIVLGTGFVVDPRIYMKNFPLTGLEGHDLREDWKDLPQAYYGTTVSGYPNMFQLVGPNTGLGHNSIIFMIESQVHYILECMRLVREQGADYINLHADAQREFNDRLQRDLEGTVWHSGCQSWYQQADGRNPTLWPHSTWKFWLRTRQVRKEHYDFVRLGNNVRKMTERAASTA
ncbi:MAG: flavin-containing monooxygenase [Pseudomonadota bacterium]